MVVNVRDMIRTRGLLIRSQTLYPAELRAQNNQSTIYYNRENIICQLKDIII